MNKEIIKDITRRVLVENDLSSIDKSEVKLPESIEIYAVEWFSSSAGNSYFAVKVVVDGQIVGQRDYEYGYGDHYVTVATEILQKLGYLPNENKNGNRYGMSAGSFSIWARENNVHLRMKKTEVKRQRDLKNWAAGDVVYAPPS